MGSIPGRHNSSSLNLLAKVETLSILYAAVFLTRIGFGTILIVFPIYLIGSNGLPLSSALTGLILALYPALEGLSALPVGAWIDRRGRRRAFVLGMTMITLLTALISSTNTDIPLVGAAHAIMGLGAAMVTISSLTMITDLTAVENRGAGMGAFDLANLSGYGVGVISGTVLETMFANSLGTIFQIVAVVFGLATLFSFLALREPLHTRERRISLKETFDNLTGDMAAIFPIWFSLTVIVGFYFFLPKIANNYNITLSRSAPIVLLGLFALGAGSLFFGRLSDKIGRTRTILLGAIGELGFLILFPELFNRITLIPPGTPLLSTIRMLGYPGIIGGSLFFLGSALVPSILAYVGDKAGKEFRGSAMGVYSLMLSAGIASGNVLAGVADTLGGVQAVFYSAAIIFAGLGLVSGLLMNPLFLRKFARRLVRIVSLGTGPVNGERGQSG
jgi:MFS family permease